MPSFPSNFTWGVATHPQIEGATDVDGRGESLGPNVH